MRRVREGAWWLEPVPRVYVAILFILICVVSGWAYATAQQESLRASRNQASTTQALCSLRADVQKRVSSGNAFLATHPHGFAGISAPTLRSSIDNSQRTVDALSSLICPK